MSFSFMNSLERSEVSVVTLPGAAALSRPPTANTLLWWGHQSTLSEPPQSQKRWETAAFAWNQVWTRLKAIWLLQSKIGAARMSFDWLNMRWFHSLPLYLCWTTWHLAEDEFAVSRTLCIRLEAAHVVCVRGASTTRVRKAFIFQDKRKKRNHVAFMQSVHSVCCHQGPQSHRRRRCRTVSSPTWKQLKERHPIICHFTLTSKLF